MKRFTVAILSFIYLAASTGVVMNSHYCMGKLRSVKLQAWAPDLCACGKKIEPKKGCCKTELKVVKVADAQKAAYAGFTVQTPAAVVVDELNLLQTSFYTPLAPIQSDGHSPPILPTQDLYLRNCVFRI